MPTSCFDIGVLAVASHSRNIYDRYYIDVRLRSYRGHALRVQFSKVARPCFLENPSFPSLSLSTGAARTYSSRDFVSILRRFPEARAFSRDGGGGRRLPFLRERYALQKLKATFRYHQNCQLILRASQHRISLRKNFSSLSPQLNFFVVSLPCWPHSARLYTPRQETLLPYWVPQERSRNGPARLHTTHTIG